MSVSRDAALLMRALHTVTPINSGGAGPPASATVNWQSSPSPPRGFCGQFPSFLYSDIPWGFVNVYTSAYSDLPAFAWNGVWVVKSTVPGGAPAGLTGCLSVSEFQGPSTTAIRLCHRPADGRDSRARAGQTYYLNVRNFSIEDGSISCSGQQQRCDALVNLVP